VPKAVAVASGCSLAELADLTTRQQALRQRLTGATSGTPSSSAAA
jgi:hypothetical protein